MEATEGQVTPRVTGFFDEATSTLSYLVADPGSRSAAIVDPVWDYDPHSGRTATRSADRLAEAVEADGLRVDWILETHAHADHLSAAHYLKERLGARVGTGEHVTEIQKTWKDIYNLEADFPTDGRQFDRLFADDESFEIGGMTCRVMHTPGHTPDSVTFLIGEAAFIGDTLFMPDYGTARCDFPGGDAATLYRSIQRLFALPPETQLFVCHDYQPEGRALAYETTVAEQRAANIHIHDGIGEAAFVALRDGRDAHLSTPTLLLPAIQVNIRAGGLPPAESNGRVYFKIPVNFIGAKNS